LRTLPLGLPALITAQSQQPALQLTVQDTIPRFSLLGAGGPGGRSAAIITTAGTLLRACVPQNANPNPVVLQRITSPGTASQWSAPGAMATSIATAAAACALAQTGSAIRLFYQSATDQKIYFRDSTDDGQTWSAEQSMGIALPLGAGNVCYGIAAASTTLVYAAYATADTNPCLWVQSIFSGGAWSAWSNTGPSAPSGWGKIRGIACVPLGGNQYFMAGVQMKSPVKGIAAATTTTAGGGAVYSPFQQVVPLDSPSLGLSLAYPSIHYDAASATWYAAVMTTDDGSLSGAAGTRTTVLTSSDFVIWRPLAAIGPALQYGAHAMLLAGQLYVFDAASCYVASQPGGVLDLSDDVLAVSVSERPNQPASLVMTLSNITGAYVNNPSLRLDARLQLSFGYGNLTVPTHTMIVEGITAQATPFGRDVVVTARDHLKLLDYPSTRLLSYSSQTVGQLAQAICREARATLAALPATPQFSQSIPCFMVSPGESWLHALQRLADAFGFTFFADPTPQVRIVEPQPGEPSTWSYGGEVLAAQWTAQSDQANWVRVVGTPSSGANLPPFADVVDGPNIAWTGSERHRVVTDRLLDSAAKCAMKAALILLAEQREANAGEILAAMNPAHELMDIVQMTDAASGLDHQPMRIAGLDLLIEPQTGAWEHRISTSGV
jgi:hypothetical protein